jgi:pyrimidine-nucleoside phosphorylase
MSHASARHVIRALGDAGTREDFRALITWAEQTAVLDEDVALLAERLAESGVRLQMEDDAADVASTGGPSSLSTLVCPLQLRALGSAFRSLVSRVGRPEAWTCWARSPGYRIHLEPAEVAAVLSRCSSMAMLRQPWSGTSICA